MREADRLKVLHSYTTTWNQGKKRWEVHQDTWLPGYTEAHKATAEEAMQYRIEKLKLEQVELDNQIFRLKSDMFDISQEKI